MPALSFEHVHNFSHVNLMEVVDGIVRQQGGVEELLFFHACNVDLAANQNLFRFVRVGDPVLGVGTRQSCCREFIGIVASAFRTAKGKCLAVRVTEKRERKEFALLGKRKGVALRTDKADRDRFIPKHAATAPACRHCIGATVGRRADEHGFFADFRKDRVKIIRGVVRKWIHGRTSQFIFFDYTKYLLKNQDLYAKGTCKSPHFSKAAVSVPCAFTKERVFKMAVSSIKCLLTLC